MQRNFGKLEAGFSQAHGTREALAYCSGCAAIVWMQLVRWKVSQASPPHPLVLLYRRTVELKWLFETKKTHLQVSVNFNVVYNAPSLGWMDRLCRMQGTFSSPILWLFWEINLLFCLSVASDCCKRRWSLQVGSLFKVVSGKISF